MITVICHNIRSAYNIGSILRTADCLGVQTVYCTGYSPLPNNPRVQKTALGAEKTIQWKHHGRLSALIIELRKDGWWVVALETDIAAQELHTVDYARYPRIALIVGNEKRGISARIRSLADAVVRIPMRGAKESLNVANAFAVAGYWIALHRDRSW